MKSITKFLLALSIVPLALAGAASTSGTARAGSGGAFIGGMGLAGEPVRAVSLAVLFWRESLIEGRILAPGKILTGKPSRAQSPEALARARARTWHSS